MSNILFNFPTLFIWALLCLSLRTTLVLCDEQPIVLSPETDIKKVSATSTTTESKVEESAAELKSKDGDTLDASPSQRSQQTDYNYVVSNPVQPINIDFGPQGSSVQSLSQEQQISSHNTQQQQQQPPSSIVYRYTTGADGVSSVEQPQEQQSYIRQEPQHQIQSLYEPNSYVRKALLGSNIPESVQSLTPSAGYKVPDLPMKPGVSTTYYSPNVKIVSHTRSFLPVVYNKPSDESSEGRDQSSGEDREQEYDKAVQERPGGSYSQQQGDSYESNGQRDDERGDQREQSGPAQQSYDKSNDYRDVEDDRDSEVLSRGPYYKIHKPHVAHIQVIEDKDEYNRGDKKEEYGGPSYGYRNQPRPQYKNYKPSGYQPGMMNVYDPPSPPLSSLLSSLPSQSDNDESDDEESYDSREQSNGRLQRLPEPQPLQQLSQSPQEYKQRPGVEIEFDQSQKNEPNVVRGPGVPYRRPNYNEGRDQSEEQQGNDGPEYNQEERPNDSYESGNRGQEYLNNNQLGPKYNIEGDEQEQLQYNRGRPQLQQKPQKPKEIQYGFIPLSEAKDISSGYRGPEPGYRGRPIRPMRPNDNGYGPEGYGGQRGYGGEMRRPQQYNGPREGMGVMFGRGQQEGHRGGGYNGNDIYHETPMGPSQPALGPYRKPAFERPHNSQFMKNGGQENSGYNMAVPYGNVPKDDEEEESEGDEGDYGKQTKQKHTKNLTDNNNEDDIGSSDPNKLPYICYPWNCNPWHAIHPDSPYNSRLPPKGRGPHSGSGLPPGASYNPRDVGLDEGVIAQLNLAASSPQGIAPGIVPPIVSPHGLRGGMGAPQMDMSYSANRPFPNYNAAAMSSQRPKPRPVPYSASGQGFRSQYGYRAAASELSPVSAAQTSSNSANSPVLSNLLNLNPVKSFRSLMSYLTGGLNE